MFDIFFSLSCLIFLMFFNKRPNVIIYVTYVVKPFELTYVE